MVEKQNVELKLIHMEDVVSKHSGDMSRTF